MAPSRTQRSIDGTRSPTARCERFGVRRDKSALHCTGGQFTLATTCKGPKGCVVERTEGTAKVKCDDSVAELGDPCEREGHYACSMDLKRIIVCRSHRFVGDDPCKAREKCAIRGETVGCF